jgi:hypothetical protein
MTENLRTCTRCGVTVPSGALYCPNCGADPNIGPLVVRTTESAVALRKVAAPLAAGAAVVVVGAGLRLARQVLSKLRLRRSQPQPPAVVEEKKPARGRVLAVRRRIWAMGDSTGARQWGVDETIWHGPLQEGE